MNDTAVDKDWLYQIILAPVISEKSTRMKTTRC